MQLSLDRQKFVNALRSAARVVSTHTSLPVLKNVLIAPKGEDRLLIGATDLETGIELEVQSTGAGDPVCVPARILLDIVSAFDGDSVAIAANGHNEVLISSGTSKYRLPTLPSEDFPSLPEVGEETTLTLASGVLRRALERTLPACSKDQTRPILTGLCLHGVEAGNLFKIVSTDTHRIHLVEDEAECPAALNVLLGAEPLRELLNLLPEEGEVTARFGKGQASFTAPGLAFFTRQIDGQFPRYERVIPSGSTRKVTMQRDEAQAAFRRLRLIARDAPAKERVILDISEGEIMGTSQDFSGAAAEERIPCTLEGDPIQIAFNVVFLIEALEALGCETVTLALTEPLSPALLTGEGTGTRIVVMPMQVQ